MPESEKVIKGLEYHMQGNCAKCPYVEGWHACGNHRLFADALALLKAQEPRVMSLEEAKSASGYVIVQSRSCNILELRLFKDGFVYDSFAEPTAVDDMWWEGYNKYWCLWTFVPTDEQMEAILWN